MQIYKFKDPTDESTHSHFLQIVLKNSLWCASPDCLNDKDEFRFALDYSPSPRTHELLSQAVARYKTSHLPPHLLASHSLSGDGLRAIASQIFDDVIAKCRTGCGITSFSATNKDERLWEVYGGKGNGVCVEINIPDHLLGDIYHCVHYLAEKVFHIDTILESALFRAKCFQTYRNMLLTKTKKWEYEQEIRFVGKRQNVNWTFDGYISHVAFGPKVPTKTFERLTKQIADHCYANSIRISHHCND